MSTTMDKIKKAMEQRKALEISLTEENQFQSAKQFIIPGKTVFWTFLMQFIGIIILGGFFYVNIEKDSQDLCHQRNPAQDPGPAPCGHSLVLDDLRR